MAETVRVDVLLRSCILGLVGPGLLDYSTPCPVFSPVDVMPRAHVIVRVLISLKLDMFILNTEGYVDLLRVFHYITNCTIAR